MNKDKFAPSFNFAQVTILHESKKNIYKQKKKLRDKLIKKQKEKKSYWPRVRVKSNSDSRNKNKKATNKNYY